MWDSIKGQLNQEKHGVSFCLAQIAFLDHNRVILDDLEHSEHEKRFYCLGKVAGGIMTVRSMYRKNKIRIIGAGYWRKGKKYMKGKIQYTDEPIGRVKVVADFLPSPEELALKDETVKVTISLSKTSIEFLTKKQKNMTRSIKK